MSSTTTTAAPITSGWVQKLGKGTAHLVDSRIERYMMCGKIVLDEARTVAPADARHCITCTKRAEAAHVAEVAAAMDVTPQHVEDASGDVAEALARSAQGMTDRAARLADEAEQLPADDAPASASQVARLRTLAAQRDVVDQLEAVLVVGLSRADAEVLTEQMLDVPMTSVTDYTRTVSSLQAGEVVADDLSWKRIRVATVQHGGTGFSILTGVLLDGQDTPVVRTWLADARVTVHTVKPTATVREQLDDAYASMHARARG